MTSSHGSTSLRSQNERESGNRGHDQAMSLAPEQRLTHKTKAASLKGSPQHGAVEQQSQARRLWSARNSRDLSRLCDAQEVPPVAQRVGAERHPHGEQHSGK